MKNRNSAKAFEAAKDLFPGGVNSPVRSWKSVGGTPFFAVRGKGATVIDADGNRYVDFVASWGPLILGHGHTSVISAVKKQARLGFSFGMPSEYETRLGTLIRKLYPSMEKMRLVSSGTEACMHAIRVARGFTGRGKIIKFEGCYHGASDAVLVKAGSGVATFGLPDSGGVPAETAAFTLTAPYNDAEAVRALLEANPNQIAAIILEPVVGNAGVLLPKDGFLQALADLAKAHGALLIFDEVMCGCRVAAGGAQQLYGVKPDMTVLGKIIGGGLPCAAYGGRAEIMNVVAPLGPVYQAGTLSGNPLAMAAGLETLRQLQKKNTYAKLSEITDVVCDTLIKQADAAGFGGRVRINRACGMFTLFFTGSEINNFEQAKAADAKLYAAFFHAMLKRGVYLPPSQFEAAFTNLAMTPDVIKQIKKAAAGAFAELADAVGIKV